MRVALVVHAGVRHSAAMNKASIANVRWSLVLAAAAAGALAVTSCGSDTLTKGSFCTNIAAAACDRGIACGFGTAADRAPCINASVADCCTTDMTCNDKPDNATQEMLLRQVEANCTTALKTFDCTSLMNGDVPAECTTVPAAAAPLTSAPVSSAAVSTAGASTPSSVGARAGQLFSSSP
jgi:hypothetical protein